MKCKLKTCKNEIPPVAQKHGDEFCSNSCCRQFHNVRMLYYGESMTGKTSETKKSSHRDIQGFGKPTLINKSKYA